MRFFLRSLIAALALLPLAAGVAGARVRQQAPVPAPPSRSASAVSLPVSANPSGRVGRVRFAAPGLLFHAAGETNWQGAAVNTPAASGEGFKSGAAGGALIEIGPDRIRLDRNTELEIALLNRASIALNLGGGRIAVRLARLDKGERAEVVLKGGKVLLLKPGRYEIAPSRIAVFEGSASFEGGGAEIALDAGKALALGAGKPVAGPVAPAPEDAFAQRRKAPERTAKGGHVSADMAGSEDLAAAGRWQAAGDLGEVWVPKGLPPGWAPYRFGHWVWIRPWGWTWIDAEPWGFAPSHYGRWARLGRLWAWVPGTRVPHPLYAPALVAFLGTRGVGVSYAGASGPAIGWFPLGPGEVYWPSYSRDLGYIRDLNRGAVADLLKIRLDANGRPPVEVVKARFANRLAASVVLRSAFAGGQAVEAALVSLPKKRLEEAPAIMGSPGITPTMLRQLAARPPAPPRMAAKAVRLTKKGPGHLLLRVKARGVKAPARRALARARVKKKRITQARRPAVGHLRVPARLQAVRRFPRRKPAARGHLIRARVVRSAPHRPLHRVSPRRVPANAKKGLRRHSREAP
jgi:Family of unknown function (DUF6600)